MTSATSIRQVRSALLSDLPAIVRIYNAAVVGGTSVADSEPITVDSRLTWFHEHNDRDRPLWVLQLQDDIVAWIGLQSYSPQPAFRRSAEVSLFVANEYQHMGHGTFLLARLIEKCPALGVDILMGVAFAHNQATIRLNQKLGFQHWGCLPQVADIGGVLRDLTIMGINLRSCAKAPRP